MRKCIGIFILLFSIGALFFVGKATLSDETYMDNVTNADKYEELINQRTEYGGLISALVFDEQKLLYDFSTNTFYYSLVEGSSSAFNPHVKVESLLEKVEIVFVDGEITEEKIENNETISVLAYSDEYFCRYNLKCTTLPIMNIMVQQGIDEYGVPMKMELFDNEKGAVKRVTTSVGKIRVRGATTSSFPKTSFRMSLLIESLGENTRQNNVSLLGLRQDDDWLLYAPYNDQEKIRNVFNTNLWTKTCGIDNSKNINTGLEYKYLELFINGEYYGLYGLGYPIDGKLLEIDEKKGENLYKKVTWANERDFYASESLTDGWVIDGFELKTPDKINLDNNYEKWGLLLEYYEQYYTNRYDNEKLLKMIDIDNAIDMYLFMGLIQGYDNTRKDLNKNMYYYLTSEEEIFKMLYIPWDMDLTWGNHYYESWEHNLVYPYYVKPEEHVFMKNGPLNQLLVNNAPGILEKIIEKYWYLRETSWSDACIAELLDFYENEIYGSGAYQREIERWPECTQANPEDGLMNFKEYVRTRFQEMDKYYTQIEMAYKQGESLLELSTEYTYSVNPLGCKDLKLYLTMLLYTDYSISVEIKNPQILDGGLLKELFTKNGIIQDDIVINETLDADIQIILLDKESKEYIDKAYFFQ